MAEHDTCRHAPPLPPGTQCFLPFVAGLLTGQVGGGEHPAGDGQHRAAVADARHVGQDAGRAEVEPAEHGAAGVGDLGEEAGQRWALHAGVQRVRNSRDHPPAGGALHQVHLRGVGGDRQVIQIDQPDLGVGGVRMLREGDDVRQQRFDTRHVLVVRTARREGQLRRQRLLPLPRLRPGCVRRGQPVAVGRIEQVGEPSGHTGAGPRGGGDPQPEVPAVERMGRDRPHLDTELDPLRRHDVLVLPDSQFLDVRVGQRDLLGPVHGGLLDQGQERGVAVGQHPPGRPRSRCTEIPAGIAQPRLGNQLPNRNQSAGAVAGPEPRVIVQPGCRAERLAGQPQQHAGRERRLGENPLGDGDLRVEPGVDREHLTGSRCKRGHPRGDRPARLRGLLRIGRAVMSGQHGAEPVEFAQQVAHVGQALRASCA